MSSHESQELKEIMDRLKELGTEQIKKIYLNHGAREPLFGVRTGDMKPLAKKIKKNQDLAIALYDTGNYDAMYFAGMISDPKVMSKSHLEHWIQGAYCQGISDYVVAQALAGSNYACELADQWIQSQKELYASAGWSCYSSLVSFHPDSYFDMQKLNKMLDKVKQSIHTSPNPVRYAMNGFVIAVGISCQPLHEQALHAAEVMGPVSVDMGSTSCKTPIAYDAICKAVDMGRIGYKRRSIKC